MAVRKLILKEEYSGVYEYNGKYRKGKRKELAEYFNHAVYNALDNIYALAFGHIHDLPEPDADSIDSSMPIAIKIKNTISDLVDFMVEEYFGI